VAQAQLKAWQPRRTDFQADTVWNDVPLVRPASHGAVTHPGAQAESHGYADI
jgi:dihydroxy-acid dehydratase